MIVENELYEYVVILVIFLCGSAFYSASETALSTVSKIRMKHLARNGDKDAAGILKLLDHFDEVLSTILVGNNIVNIGTASIATLLCIKLIGDEGSVSIATAITTVVVLVVGEISPKSLAKEYSEPFLLSVHKLLWWNTWLFAPLNFVFKQLKGFLSHKISGKGEAKPTITEAELKVMVDEVENEGTISEEESDLIKSAIEFNDIRVKEILTPRVDMVACSVTNSNAEIYRLFTTNHFTRIPVYDEEENNIIGLLHAKDFYNSYLKDPKFNIKTILKNIAYVHRSTKISLLLKNLQHNKLQMAALTVTEALPASLRLRTYWKNWLGKSGTNTMKPCLCSINWETTGTWSPATAIPGMPACATCSNTSSWTLTFTIWKTSPSAAGSWNPWGKYPKREIRLPTGI